MLPEQQQRILGYFIEEATDHLNTIEQGLLNLQSTLNDPDLINEVFRAAHSIKGGAAMLGLNSIQRTSHRLEDCFKVLKDNPVKIDQKLESLFLGVSDTLKALLEHLSGPFGLTEETANTLMAEAEPVFGWLIEHLDKLVKESTGNKAPQVTGDNELHAIENRAVSGNNNNRELQTEVMNNLRQMLQLFKQPETPENRSSIEECTAYLAELGDKWNLSSWSHLCREATSAIANKENSYLTLAKIVITEIKQALELVLSNRENEIVISEQLEALLPIAEIELLEINSLEDEPDTELLLKVETDNYEEVATLEALHLTDNKNEVVEDVKIAADSVEVENNIPNLLELSEQIDNQLDGDAPIVINGLDIQGPEVGIAELNTLADLFEGESPELDETWQREEIIDLEVDNTEKSNIDANIENSKETDSEFEDFLLFEEENNKDNQTTVKEEMTIMQLFGEDFSEEDLENLKDTGSTDFNSNDLFADDNLQQVSNVEVIDDLLELSFENDNQNTSEDELNSLLSENRTEQEESENHIVSFDDLFAETAAEDAVTEISGQQIKIDLPSFEEVGLDTLFGEVEEPELEDDRGDLFENSEEVLLENSGNIWEKTQIISHEDVAKALEETLLEATSYKDIFPENESSEAAIPDFEPEELDNNLPKVSEAEFDSIFSGDAVDDLLELALSGDQGVFDRGNDNELFILELDNSTEDSSIEENSLTISSPAENLLEVNSDRSTEDSSIEEDSLTISSPAENLPEVNNNDSQIEISDNPFAQQSPDINLRDSDNYSQSLESPFELEIIQDLSENNDYTPENLEDIAANTQAQLIDDLFAQDIPLDEEITLQ
ncbi:MAG: Hpt domain-containing protein, partial [Cyanobacteria bacterium P01_D01_bin.50]